MIDRQTDRERKIGKSETFLKCLSSSNYWQGAFFKYNLIINKIIVNNYLILFMHICMCVRMHVTVCVCYLGGKSGPCSLWATVLPLSYMPHPDLSISCTNCLHWGFISTERSSKVGDVAVGLCVSGWGPRPSQGGDVTDPCLWLSL